MAVNYIYLRGGSREGGKCVDVGVLSMFMLGMSKQSRDRLQIRHLQTRIKVETNGIVNG